MVHAMMTRAEATDIAKNASDENLIRMARASVELLRTEYPLNTAILGEAIDRLEGVAE